MISVHGDDITASGPKIEPDWGQHEMESRYELTIGDDLDLDLDSIKNIYKFAFDKMS